MSFYTTFVKNEIGYSRLVTQQYTNLHSTASDDRASVSQIDSAVSLSSNHNSLGQITSCEKGKPNPTSDEFSSEELHRKSSDILRLYNV